MKGLEHSLGQSRARDFSAYGLELREAILCLQSCEGLSLSAD